MTERRNVVLAALFLLQVALILIVYSPFSSRGGFTEARALLPALQGVTPAKIEIEDADGNRVVLVKQADGWGLEALEGYPADPEKVDRVLDSLKDAKVRRPTVNSPRYHQALKVAEDTFERRVRVWAAGSDDAPAVDLLLGTSPNYRLTHVRLAGEDAVYEVAGLAPFDFRAEPSAWVRNKIVDVDADRVARVEVRNPKGRFVLEKSDEGGWKVVEPAGRSSVKLDSDKVMGFVRWAGSLWISEPAGKLDAAAMGFDPPYATIALTLRSPEPATEPDETQAEERAGQEDEAKAPSAAEKKTGGGDGSASGSTTDERGPKASGDADADEAGPVTQTVVVKIGGPVPDAQGERYITREGFGYAARIRESSIKQLLEKTLADLRVE